ncbi:MAG: exodeoxyribonuclease VII small subunit [Candidatus Dormiibacterota bacterium]
MNEQEAAPPVEELLARLERAVRRLADQSAPLERLVADWEEANQLVTAADRRLEAAQGRIAELDAGRQTRP